MKKICNKFYVVAALSLMTILFSSPITTRKAIAQTCAEGKAECVMEVNSRRVLYQSHGETRLPMASTTKIVTAITVLNLCTSLEEKISIPKEAIGIEGSSVYLKANEIFTIEELLYGLMLRSGNDCAVALALHCSGSIERFSAEMNKTAQKAGAFDSNFKNPHGLPCEGHYTTAHDLTLITCYAMQNDTFRNIVQTQVYSPKGWVNKNKMLKNYPGAIGVKTGYTQEAGRCLVSAAQRNGMTLVCTVLNCPTMYERSTQLLDDAFAAYSYQPLLKADEIIVVDGKEGISGKNYYYPLLAEEKELITVETCANHLLKKKKQQEIIGQFKIYLAKRLLFSGNLYKL